MRYFFHIVTDEERLRDDEGADFPSLAAARAEASQAARDLMAEELRYARPVPISWRVQIAAEDETILLTLPFVRIAFPRSRVEIVASEVHLDSALIARAKATVQNMRRSKDGIAQGLTDMRRSLRRLHALTSTLSSSS